MRAQLKGTGGIAFTQPFGVVGLEKDNELTAVVMTAGGTTISAEMPAEIALSLSATDSVGAEMNLDGAEIVYFTNQTDYLSVDSDGVVSLVNAPSTTSQAEVWAKVT